jgi:hypothetical protein
MIEKPQKHRILSNFTKKQAFNDSHPPIRQLQAHEALVLRNDKGREAAQVGAGFRMGKTKIVP